MSEALTTLDGILKFAEEAIQKCEAFGKLGDELIARVQSETPSAAAAKPKSKPSKKKLSKAEKKAAKQKKFEEKKKKQKLEAERLAKKKAKAGGKKKTNVFKITKKERNVQAPNEEKASLSEEMAGKYDPGDVEFHWDQWWRAKGHYKPQMNSKKEKFVMMIPPPNVTGSLHLGHALMAAIEDAITRYYRMKGKNCLWLPGTDHAGIATQTVVERMIARDGLTRHDLGREKFLEKVWEWKDANGGRICSQLRRLGCSVDWDREVFTMDKMLNRAVVEAFVRMFEKGKIYRSKRLCHWSCTLKSAISSAEVDPVVLEKPTEIHVPGYDKPVKFGVIHAFAYKIKGTNEEIIVQTTRLETMLGDTAVAVHPEDPRYKKFHGKFVEHPFFPDRVMPIILDPILVDMSFGTGAVKITPCHDENDFESGKRHNLESIVIFDEDGLINENGGQFQGQKRYHARYNIMDELKKRGQWHGEKANPMTIGMCSRSKDIIEPLPIPQWWVDCTEMAKRSTDAVRSGELTIIGHRGKETFFDYLDNIRPWCISRQLWWGHQCPAYQVILDGKPLDDEKTESWIAARSMKEAMEKAKLKYPGKKIELRQDEDVLDTWFSSGLFPFSTLGWPDDTPDMREFFPGSLLETGHDIIFFWVARMVMMSLELTDQLPFTEVFLHPMVKDKHGGKMSKSKGNVIDPLHIIDGTTLDVLVKELHRGNLKPEEAKKAEKDKRKDFPEGIPACGADALRFGLLDYLAQGRSINLDVARVVGWRRFGNKIWQAQSFVNFMVSSCKPKDWVPKYTAKTIAPALTRPVDIWILNLFNQCVSVMDEKSGTYEFAEVTHAFYDFFFNNFCAVYIEAVKPVFPKDGKGDPETQEVVLSLLMAILESSYRAIHPLMPFISEELWQRIPGDKGAAACIVAEYPTFQKEWANSEHDEVINFAFTIVEAIRSMKTELGLVSERPNVFISHTSDLPAYTLELISTLAKVGDVSMAAASDPKLKKCLKQTLSKDTDFFLEKGNIDLTKEIAKTKKQLKKKESFKESILKKLNNPKFSSKAKPEVIEKEKQKLADVQAEIDKLKETVSKYEQMA